MPKVCLVTSEIVGPFKNGGIGTHNYYLMQYLAEIEEIDCTVVYNGAIETNNYDYWANKFRSEFKAEFIWISPENADILPRSDSSCYWERISQGNLDYLRNQNFDIILFQEMLGGGFRAIQAKRSLGLFATTTLAVMVHSSWQWVNESMQLFPVYGLPEMLTKYMERYSVEHCDVLVSPSQYMLDWTATEVVHPAQRQHVVPYLFDPALQRSGPPQAVRELIFFGRLEQRKGLILFLESLQAMRDSVIASAPASPIPVYFLGRPGQTEDGDGSMTIQKFEPLLKPGFDLHVISDLGHHEALEFLRSHPAAMVVCPSLQDNSPFAVIENILLGTNLICCSTGGIPELFADESRLARPTVADLSRLLMAGIRGQLPELRPAYSIEKARAAWRQFLADHLHHADSTPPPASARRGAAEGGTTATLGLVSHPSPTAATKEDGAQRFPGLAVLPGELLGRDQRAFLSDAQACSHLVVLGGGFQLTADALNTLQEAIHSCPSCVWTGYAEYHSSQPVLDTPFGPCLEAVLAENILGTGLAILPVPILQSLDSKGLAMMYRVLQDVDGFWSFLAHIALLGHPLDVIPQTLCSTDQNKLQTPVSAARYAERAAIIATMSSQIPRWASRLLPYVVDLTPSYQAQAAATSSQSLGDRRSLLSLLRYYWRRIKG